jgi:predicted transcriptional regulator YheO
MVKCNTKCKISSSELRPLGDWLLSQQARLAEALAKMFHPLLEAVVHDYRPPKPGIATIFGGHITGRKLGDPLTELGKYRLRGRPVDDNLVGYRAESASGRKMKSASLAIRLPSGELIGSLCFNVDLSIIDEVKELLATFTTFSEEAHVPRIERFRSRAPRDEVAAAIFHQMRSKNLTVKQLSQADREEIVRSIADQGLLSRRGAITVIARTLGITRPTVYRYLSHGGKGSVAKQRG